MKFGLAVTSLAALSVLASSRDARPCRCAGGLELVQVGEGKPRDCTCINGMKTYPVTPRDDLKAMGSARLLHHLKKCERDRENLDNQKDYAIADAEAQEGSMKKMVSRKSKALESYTNRTKDSRIKVVARKTELTEQIKESEKELAQDKADYNSQFSAWFKLNKDMTQKMDRLKGCASKLAACDPLFLKAEQKKRKNAALLSRSVATLSPNEEQMYDRIQKVGECEEAVNKLTDGIEKAQAKTRKTTIDADNELERLGNRVSDRQIMDRILDVRPQLQPMRETKRTLESAIYKEEMRVKDYKVKNEWIKQDLKELDAELKKCGC